jgi:carbonic anhydrase
VLERRISDSGPPLVPANIPIYGYLYDIKTGHLVEVPAATQAGAAL